VSCGLILRKLGSRPKKRNYFAVETYFFYHTGERVCVCVCECVCVLTTVLCFFKFRPAVGQDQFSSYRELNSRPVTCWTVSCVCLLLFVHFGIPRGPYIKIHQKLNSARSSSEYTDQLLLMRCLWCRPPILFFT